VRLSRARPMHPGANVSMDLVIWLVACVTGSLLLLDAIAEFVIYNSDYDYLDSGYSYNPSNTAILEISAVGVTYGIMIFHFVLFVWACRDTHVRNRAGHSAEAARIATQMVVNMQPQGTVGQGYGRAEYAGEMHSQEPLFTADGRQMSGFYPAGGFAGAQYQQQQQPYQQQPYQQQPYQQQPYQQHPINPVGQSPVQQPVKAMSSVSD